jgi:hypothetical protein
MSELNQVLGPNGEVWATAPDATWNLYGESWPEPNVQVEACWCSRFKEPAEYEYAPVTLVRREADNMSVWANERGEELLFNPDFWRPLVENAKVGAA